MSKNLCLICQEEESKHKKNWEHKFLSPKIVKIVAKEIVEGINKQQTRKKENNITIKTLCNFGELGLLTPLDLAEAFYNSIIHLKKHGGKQ